MSEIALVSGVVIAVDGPSASGKGTIARRLAERFHLAYLDTGLLYRKVGFLGLRDSFIDGMALNANEAEIKVLVIEATTRTDWDDASLRTEAAARAASIVGAVTLVRTALLESQRGFAAQPPPLPDGTAARGAVLDGRDIGTVICPEADYKFFVTASVEERARRRFLELQGRGEEATYEAVLEDLVARDARDRERSASPLQEAEDAFVLETTEMNADQAFAKALEFIRKQTP